jgi:DNA-binding CsgD family transcriptional regulator/PAS domain-containing protein
MLDYDKLVGSIYDCAANPELWPMVLSDIRDHLSATYCLLGYVDMNPTKFGHAPFMKRATSPWDEKALLALEGMLSEIPQGAMLFDSGIDTGWTQMTHMTEEEFQKTPFYLKWAKVYGLRDTVNVAFFQRPGISGAISAPRGTNQDLYGADEIKFIERISPHIRRAVQINELADSAKMALTLHRTVLDQLNVAVFILGLGRRIIFTNAAGEAMLSDGKHLRSVAGALSAQRILGVQSALDDAIDRANAGDTRIGISGIGVPLVAADGTRTAAYVLPIAGKDVRGELGKGHCAVFVAQRGAQQPMVIEVLRTLFDLTMAEARVSLMVAKGDGPQTIADTLNVSVNTVRTHLKHAYAKTRSTDQTSLSGLVNGLLPPV